MGVYSGSLYQRLSLRVPGAVVFDEIGRAAMGTPGSAMVYATIYMTIFCEPIIFHITCMETLRQVGDYREPCAVYNMRAFTVQQCGLDA
jgi:hypothetical protein